MCRTVNMKCRILLNSGRYQGVNPHSTHAIGNLHSLCQRHDHHLGRQPELSTSCPSRAPPPPLLHAIISSCVCTLLISTVLRSADEAGVSHLTPHNPVRKIRTRTASRCNAPASPPDDMALYQCLSERRMLARAE
jgi:hypothetical protein